MRVFKILFIIVLSCSYVMRAVPAKATYQPSSVDSTSSSSNVQETATSKTSVLGTGETPVLATSETRLTLPGSKLRRLVEEGETRHQQMMIKHHKSEDVRVTEDARRKRTFQQIMEDAKTTETIRKELEREKEMRKEEERLKKEDEIKEEELKKKMRADMRRKIMEEDKLREQNEKTIQENYLKKKKKLEEEEKYRQDLEAKYKEDFRRNVREELRRERGLRGGSTTTKVSQKTTSVPEVSQKTTSVPEVSQTPEVCDINPILLSDDWISGRVEYGFRIRDASQLHDYRKQQLTESVLLTLFALLVNILMWYAWYTFRYRHHFKTLKKD